MSDDDPETSGTKERLKIITALVNIWEGFNTLRTWKPFAWLLAFCVTTCTMWAHNYKAEQDRKRVEWTERRAAFQTDVTGTIHRIEDRQIEQAAK